MLEIVGLVKEFGKHVVVDGISFCVGDGEVVGFVGPNGAGKSTTMKIISGLLRPTSGRVTIDGVACEECPQDYLAKIGALIESPAFYPSLNAKSHLTYLARMRGESIGTLIDRTLSRVGLDPASNKPVRQYSTGMKQRLGIAMAVLHSPRLLILDEPTNGLDPAAIVAMRGLLRQLGDDGIAVLVSSHLLFEIERVCDRVVFIKSGQVIRDQPVQHQLQNMVKVLVVCKSPQRAYEILASAEFAEDVHRCQDGLVCTVSEHRLGMIAATLVHSGIELLELSPVKGELEDFYIQEYGPGMREDLK